MPSDPWDDLITQVEASLDNVDYPQGPMREAVLEGIRCALAGLEEPQPTLRLVEPAGEPTGDPAEAGSADRRADAPRSGRPALRLAHRRSRSADGRAHDPGSGAPGGLFGGMFDHPLDDASGFPFGDMGDDSLDDDSLDDDSLDDDSLNDALFDRDTTDPGFLFRRPARERPLHEAGTIFLAAAGSGQPVYQGRAVRSYRISCTLGAFEIRVDGDDPIGLQEGQSVDVEGSRIRVGAPAPAGSEGAYARLPG